MARSARRRPPRLPDLVQQKMTKTGYTRGATTKEIFQNRVTRNNTVLIDWDLWDRCSKPDDGTGAYENGFLVLVEPSWYFETADADDQLASQGLELGVNALLLFRRRSDWAEYAPGNGRLPNGKPFDVATSRSAPLGGTYFARVHATVSDDGAQVIRGFNTKRLRGAGIRVYEYASSTTIARARLQLEALFWMCHDSQPAVRDAGMPADGARARMTSVLEVAEQQGLLDRDRLHTLRVINGDDTTSCPLCMAPVSAADFMKRGEQAEGRETYDLTITAVSLFHIQELRVGKLQHKPYNLGWGHHFCNVVTKDAGIMPTLGWMERVLANQAADSDLASEAESVEEAVDR